MSVDRFKKFELLLDFLGLKTVLLLFLYQLLIK